MPPRQLASIRPLPMLSLRKPREAIKQAIKSHEQEVASKGGGQKEKGRDWWSVVVS